MRPIKFRVFDQETKKMEFVGAMDWADEESPPITVNTQSQKLYRYDNGRDFILMQFTGLLDKNGKEIYEGDILRQRKGKWSGKGLVVFCEGVYWWERESGGSEELYLAINNEEIKVIGNIYENPELLKCYGH